MKIKNSKIAELNLFVLLILIFSLPAIQTIDAHAKLSISNLRTEYKTNPLGIDTKVPRLSWEILSDTRNILQTAYEIKSANSPENLKADKSRLWNAGKIESDRSIQIEYKGPALKTGERVYWQVRVWDNQGNVSEWSEPAFWEMGLLHSTDWKADWIEPEVKEDIKKSKPCPFLRNEFHLKQHVKQARLYVSSHGMSIIHLNGKKVGNQVFTPGWTSYNKRLQYQTYDVTDLVNKGENAVGAILGDGWYRGPLAWEDGRNKYGEKLALIAQIKIIFTDGSEKIVATDKNWKSTTGPILKSELYDGEIYDACLEMAGWDKPGFEDKKWQDVKLPKIDKKKLIASYGPPVKIVEEIKPVKKIKAPNGETILDMGQNMVGWLQFKLSGEAGTKITLRHAEVLDQKGNLYTENLRAADQMVQYIFKGIGEEIFEPHFTFQGFRYVAVADYPGEIDLDNFTGKVIYSAMTPSGNFGCSDEMINQLQHNIQWGLKGNFVDVPTDCPQRDERLGWMGDAQVFAPTACFNMDAASFYTKWLGDVAADQYPDGSVPHVIPNVIRGGAATGWADACTVIPWALYRTYGDKQILETQYASMKAWVDYMKSRAGESYLWNKDWHFGDWLAFNTTQSDYPGATTDKDLLATAYFYHSTNILQKAAAILGKTEDSNAYADLASKIKAAFQQEFITHNGRLSSNTQTAYVLALAFNLFPEVQKKIAAKRLARDVQAFKHITTGFLGTPLIAQVLTETGYPELAYMLLFRKEYPSWLYPITRGATTIWERWDGIKPDGSFQDKGMNSFNHYAYGAIGNWLYSYVAGIQQAPESIGYKQIIIKPELSEKLSFAKAEYHSIYGKISSNWKRDGKKFSLNVVIPPNTTAKVCLPGTDSESILENAKPVSNIKGIKVSGMEDGRIVLEVGSGEWDFTSAIENMKE